MKLVLWIAGIVAVAVGFTLAARYNSGYLLLVLPPYRVEFALNFLRQDQKAKCGVKARRKMAG